MSQEDVPLAERKQYFVSDQTWEGLQICVKSFVEVVKISLTIPEVSYVVVTKLNQDPLEKFFGKLRQTVSHMQLELFAVLKGVEVHWKV